MTPSLNGYKKLNLGAGNYPLDGWHNYDMRPAKALPVRGLDLLSFPWPFDDASASDILLSHVLEHFTKADARLVLRECYRVLAPRGWLHVAVPDMDIFIDAKITGNTDAIRGYFWKSLETLLGGDERELRPEQRHKYMYNWETLSTLMEEAGFVAARRQFVADMDNPEYQTISLYVSGVKL